MEWEPALFRNPIRLASRAHNLEPMPGLEVQPMGDTETLVTIRMVQLGSTLPELQTGAVVTLRLFGIGDDHGDVLNVGLRVVDIEGSQVLFASMQIDARHLEPIAKAIEAQLDMVRLNRGDAAPSNRK